MTGNLEDKVKFGLREYDGYDTIESGVRVGSKQEWVYKRRIYLIERGHPGYYYKKPHQIVREFKAFVDRDFPYDSGARVAPPPTPLEKYEGEIYHEPLHYEEAKREFEHKEEERTTIPTPEAGKVGGLVLLMGALVVLWYFLFANMRRG